MHWWVTNTSNGSSPSPPTNTTSISPGTGRPLSRDRVNSNPIPGLCERDPCSDLAFNISMFQVTDIVPFQPWSWNLIKRCKSCYQPNMVNKSYIKSELSWLHVSGCQGGWGSHLSPIVFQPAHKLHTHQHQHSSSTNTNCKHTQIT